MAITIQNGNTPAPAYTFNSDNDTGMYTNAGHIHFGSAQKCSCPTYPWAHHLGKDPYASLVDLLHKLLHLSPYGTND